MARRDLISYWADMASQRAEKCDKRAKILLRLLPWNRRAWESEASWWRALAGDMTRLRLLEETE